MNNRRSVSPLRGRHTILPPQTGRPPPSSFHGWSFSTLYGSRYTVHSPSGTPELVFRAAMSRVWPNDCFESFLRTFTTFTLYQAYLSPPRAFWRFTRSTAVPITQGADRIGTPEAKRVLQVWR